MLHRLEEEEEEEEDRTSDLTILAHDTVYLEHLEREESHRRLRVRPAIGLAKRNNCSSQRRREK